ncbi:MAG TPA: hypothetical protein PKE12_14165 [Kiritimatiellia bacterium]|nr:hypothetical protein [Kiritimatiellia bacterium]
MRLALSVLFALACVEPASYAAARPLMRDFMGLNGHYHFKPDLYRPAVRLVRNYHDLQWDVAKPGDPPTFPRCVNGVDWSAVYGPWRKAGFEISACAQFRDFGAANPNHRELWAGREKWARTYGGEMARVLGPTKGAGLISSIEIDNEPGNGFDDALYQRIFREMASGIRAADPAIRIVTCTVHTGPADKYHKNLDETFGDKSLLPLYDVINVHTYAELPEKIRKHPWDRTFPEDSRSPFLKNVDDVIAWRDRHAPGKQVWVTEFGWDACTEAAMACREGWFEKLGWTVVSDLQQAQYLVRAFLLLAARDVERAYIFYYDDNDEPSVHAASGLTRKFQPKPALWAVSQLQDQLGDHRFKRIVHEKDGIHVYAFANAAGQERWVAWSSAGEAREFNFGAIVKNPGSISVVPMATGPDAVSPRPATAVMHLGGSVSYLIPPRGR